MSAIKAKTKHILIIEDNKDMQEIYKIFFSDQTEKYTIEIIGDSQAALKRLKEEDFDLLILDIIMQPISGDSIYVYLRENLKNRNTPVIVISVLTSGVLKNLKKMNNISIFQKPITKEQLLKEIDEILA